MPPFKAFPCKQTTKGHNWGEGGCVHECARAATENKQTTKHANGNALIAPDIPSVTQIAPEKTAVESERLARRGADVR